MPLRPKVALEPRKSPVQARSAASVEAILEATIQVLRSVGKERLTTTRVAQRAGVSVGTLYQYFPNKSALLQAALKGHLEQIAVVVERVCREQKSKPLQQMATALITGFLEAKMRNVNTSLALYSVNSDVDGAKILRQIGTRSEKAIVRMLSTAPEPLTTDPNLVASMLPGSNGRSKPPVTGIERSPRTIRDLAAGTHHSGMRISAGLFRTPFSSCRDRLNGHAVGRIRIRAKAQAHRRMYIQG